MEPPFGLSEAELREMIRRLVVFARGLLSRRIWRHIHGGIPPGAMTAEDFVQRAFAKLLSGERHNLRERPQIEFLMEIIASDISHECRKRENRASHAAIREKASDSDPDAPETPSTDRMLEDPSPSAEDVLLAGDSLRLVQAHFGNDHLLSRYAELLADGQDCSAMEYANLLGVPVQSIFNMNRRLKRFWNRSVRKAR